MKNRFFTACWATMLICAPLIGGGFSIYEHGGRAMGVAGAFTARADDASALFFNPAGIAFLEGTHFYGGVTLIAPDAKFSGVAPFPGFGVQEQTADNVFTPPTLFVAHRFNRKLALGLGVYVPYGLGVEWDNKESYSGRWISKNVELQSFYFSPEIAYQVTEQLAIAAGVQYVYSTVNLEQTLNQPFNGAVLDIADVVLEGNNGGSFAFDVSALYKASDRLQLGAIYRNQVSNDYTGDASFTQILSGDPALDAIVKSGLPANASGGNTIGVATQVTFPWQFAGGIMYRLSEDITVEFDYMRFGWSTFDELPFDFAAERKEGDVNTPETAMIPEDYEDTNQFRVGAEYQLLSNFALRAGYIFDDTPQPVQSLSLLLPDANRHDITLGFGYDTGPFTIDAAYMLIVTGGRSTEGRNSDNYNGTYDFGANLFGLSLGYRL